MTSPKPSRLVVDTNVISYIFKGDSRGPTYEQQLQGVQAIISFQTLAELEEWTLNSRWGEIRKQKLYHYLQQFTTLYADDYISRIWGYTMHIARKNGQRMDPADAWVAATALALNCPLITHNASDFSGVEGLKVITKPDT